ncbi:probable peroxin-1 [Cephalotrichum gorgonifer]|uniref:Peroxisomal ATPase PEX1 n=1 Tax=Cephalotrichum gorgonifer TaxID=2041049 RepID=A0AAE8SQM2_9PEZI|nr:probable peroxin-1 [Cephalotrichum gorgonifer]
MAPQRNARSTPAEISYAHLKSCLVNLPATLESLLVNLNTPAQNVVVELSYQPSAPGSPSPAGASRQNVSVYLGWTGMPSRRKPNTLVSRDGINGLRGSQSASARDAPLLEIDAILANNLGLTEGQKVLTTVHIDPPLVHTINIEPVTTEDWEVIELHANFLELNMQSQIRALPNPAFSLSAGTTVAPHPLTVHLSPTTTANIKVTSLEPALSPDQPFAKVSPDAEVIVAPKTRSKSSQHGRGDTRSDASTSKSKKSRGSASAKKRNDEPPLALYLRGMDRASCGNWFDDEPAADLSVWADEDTLSAGGFGGVNYVVVHVMSPSGLHLPSPEEVSSVKSSETIVAKLRLWEDSPNSQAVALSSPLCAALGYRNSTGGIIKLQPAPTPLQRSSVKSLKVFPFATSDSKEDEGIRFGGESKSEKEEAAKRFKAMYCDAEGLLGGSPITDGTVFGEFPGLHLANGWEGGLVKFEPEPKQEGPVTWVASLDSKVSIQFQQPIPRPSAHKADEPWELTPSPESPLAGVDALADNLFAQLRHMSSTLLTGGMGSGKTSLVKQLAQKLRQDLLYHTIYLPCKSLVNEEIRTATIKETLTRVFTGASWGARLGGKSIVILDDLDKLCPAETELVVGNDNERSRLLSETIVSIVKQYCDRSSGVVLLATAGGKDSIHKVLVGGHMVRETIDLKAPDKEARKQVLDSIVNRTVVAAQELTHGTDDGSRPGTANGEHSDGWMEGTGPLQGSPRKAEQGFTLDPDLDLLDVAGLTDGYMPADIFTLVSRARNEAIFRVINGGELEARAGFRLGKEDFDKALKDFTPASLRNVPLQKSTTTFASIGGLKETRQVLLETLQYPTKYAPLFAKCPLRLRSGLLLYGYPGCGKTLLASAVAGECGLNFISVKGPEILNKYIGASEKTVRDLFERASAAKPCVLFFDEFDSIAPKRGHDSTGVTDRVVNQLLTQMDGAEGLSGVYVLAATSRPDLIDSALLRPGRLDKSLLCDLPNIEDRLDILKAMAKKVRLEKDLEESDAGFAELARRTEGFSGADMQALVSNAQLEAIHDVLKGQDFVARTGVAEGKAGDKAGTPSFVQFRYGRPTAASTRGSKAAELAENARILSKLENIRLAKKKAKLVQKTRASGGAEPAAKEARESQEAVVGWDHFEAALEGMRASISAAERTRLARIYREFVGDRSGEMRDGQGGFEIGGRTSLM